MGLPKSQKGKCGSGSQSNLNVVDTSKPTAVFAPTKGRSHTVSVALPGSIISNAQSHDLKTTLAGQIARALAVFCVDEIVIFNDGQSKPRTRGPFHDTQYPENNKPSEQAYTGYSDPDGFLIHILSYLETPPHLRKFLFPMHPNLRTAGMLPSLDMPHHLRAHEWCQYREGFTVETTAPPAMTNGTHSPKPKKSKKRKLENPSPSLTPTPIETGLPHQTFVPLPPSLPPYTRVTLKYPSAAAPLSFSSFSSSSSWPSHNHNHNHNHNIRPNTTDPLTALAVSPTTPRKEAGYYWGYAIRRAASLSAVFTECTYDNGYDLTIGTSERGVPLSSLFSPAPPPSPSSSQSSKYSPPALPKFKHLLLVFGGVAGLEVAANADEELVAMGVGKGVGLEGPEKLFDYWVDLCPGQGSRTIRTDEALWIGLMGVRGLVVGNGDGDGAGDGCERVVQRVEEGGW